MKPIKFYYAFLLIIVTLFSCKSKKDTVAKDVKPLKTEVGGYLSEYLQIVDGIYQATKDQALIPSWVVKVKVKAIKPYTISDEGFKDGNGGPLTLDLYDDKGAPLTELDNLQSTFQDDSKLLDILTKGTGETWVTFTKFNYSKGLQDLPDNTASFAINSENKGSSSGTTTVAPSPVHNFTGTVDKYPVTMTLNIVGTDITGTYKYKSQTASLNLKGNIDGEKLTLNEYDPSGNKSGSFTGKLSNGVYEGQWTSLSESKMMNFKLVEEKNNNENYTSPASSTTGGGAGSENWNQLLDDYDSYVDSYIKFYKKAQAGDESAIAEYPTFMEKTLAVEKSLQKAKQDKSLTTDQAMRMLKIQTKMVTEISKK